MNYQQSLQALFDRSRGAGIRLGLDVMRQLMHALGSPEKQLRCVLVAGTNGKGSTCQLLSDALRRSGAKVGLITSPHLLRFAERIRIDGTPVDDACLMDLMKRVGHAEQRCERPPTFFEAATAMGLQAFADARVDWAVVEVGLGGRLDATNVVPRELSVVTPVDLDHQEYLGDNLAAIAAEKADIIAPGRSVVLGPQQPAAMEVLERVALSRNAPIITAEPWTQLPAHVPDYQAVNFGIARAAALALGCSDTNIAAAVEHFCWPGRYQWVAGAPPVLLDGGHNPAGVAALCDAMAKDPRLQGRRLHAVFTALHGKDAQPMAAMLHSRVHSMHLCPVASKRTRTPDELRTLAPGCPVYATAAAALEGARTAAGADGVVIVAGSLFLVADVLARVSELPRDPAVDG